MLSIRSPDSLEPLWYILEKLAQVIFYLKIQKDNNTPWILLLVVSHSYPCFQVILDREEKSVHWHSPSTLPVVDKDCCMNNISTSLIKKIRYWLVEKVAKSHHKIHFQDLNGRRILSLNLYIDQCTLFHFIELTTPRTTKNGEIWFLRNPSQLALQLQRGGSTGCSRVHCSSQHTLTLKFGFLLPCDGWKVQWQAPKWDTQDAVVHSIQMA